jgi:hypothetical protein
MDSTLSRNELFAQMESDKPYAAYIKKILGKVVVTVWDNILEKPQEVILYGDPRRREDSCIVKVWSPKEKIFFERNNKVHFDKGRVLPYEVPSEAKAVVEKTIEQASDDELKNIVNTRYFGLLSELNKINSVAVLFRMQSLAEEMEKSEKITGAIRARISELNNKEFPQVLEVELEPRDEE